MNVKLENVSLSRGGQHYLYPVNLNLEENGFHILLGATNAGKTSLMKIVAGLEKPSSGKVLFNDVDVTKFSPQKRNISFVHQFFVNYPHMTVYDNIASPLRVAGQSAAEIKPKVEKVAEMLKLKDMLKRYPQNLSGGQQQRTALARALAKDADIVLLDEPFANLDYKLREELREQLPNLMSGRGTMVIYATSEPSEALLLGGHTAIIHEGKVVQHDRTADLYHNPKQILSVSVFSDPPINRAKVQKKGERIYFDDGVSWQLKSDNNMKDGEYIMAIRPHCISPICTDKKHTKITGEIKITELSGSQSVAHFNINDLVWVSQTSGVHNYDVGQVNDFYMDHDQCFYFHPDGSSAI